MPISRLQAFDDLCKPSATPAPAPGVLVPSATQNMSPLNCFLGCLYLRRHLQNVVRQEAVTQLLQSTDPNVVAFKADYLTCRVASRPENAFQTLHLKIEQDPAPQVQVRELYRLEVGRAQKLGSGHSDFLWIRMRNPKSDIK